MPFDTPNKRKLKRRNIEEHGRSLKEQQGEFKGSDFTVGCTTAVIDEQQITEILSKHKDKFEGKFIVAIPVDEDLSKISWRGQDHMVRKYFYQVANMFFATNRGTIDFGLGKNMLHWKIILMNLKHLNHVYVVLMPILWIHYAFFPMG